MSSSPPADAAAKRRPLSLDPYVVARSATGRVQLRQPAVGQPRFVTIDAPSLVRAIDESTAQGREVSLTLLADMTVRASMQPHRIPRESDTPGYGHRATREWSGRLAGGGSIIAFAYPAAVTTRIELSVWSGARSFTVEPVGDDNYVIYEHDPAGYLTPEPTSRSEASAPHASAPGASAASHGQVHQAVGPAGAIGAPYLPVVVTIAVLFTPAAQNYAGGAAGIRDRVNGLVALANGTHRNSMVPIHFQVAAIAATTTIEGVDAAVDLRQLRFPLDGRFDEAATLRAGSNADLVVLVGVGYSTDCGVGFQYQNHPPAHVESFGYAVVSLDPPGDYFCNPLTLAHELGHNLGADHDWNNLQGDPAFRDAHGHQNPQGGWATAMSYVGLGSGCDPCVNVPHWSNPEVAYGGAPTGATGGAHAANNARVLTATAESIDAYRPMRTDRYGPGATAWGSERMDLVARGTDDAIHHRPWTAAGGWGSWTPIHTGATTKADPDVASAGQGRLGAVHLGGDGAVWWASFTGTAWSGWSSLGGMLTSAPSIVSHAPGELQVFGRGMDGALWTRSTARGSWQPWMSLGGIITSDPDATSWAPGRVDVFARGADGAIWHRARTPADWSGWDSLGRGILTSAPTAVSWGPGRIDIFARGADGHLWHNAWSENHWYGWYLDLGGVLTSAPDALSRSPGTLDVYGRGTDGALWRRTWNGSAWQPWASIG